MRIFTLPSGAPLAHPPRPAAWSSPAWAWWRRPRRPTASFRRGRPSRSWWRCSGPRWTACPAPSPRRRTSAFPSCPGAGGSRSSDFNSLVSGTHTLRVWYAAPDKSRVALLGTLGRVRRDHERDGRVDLVQRRQRGHPPQIDPAARARAKEEAKSQAPADLPQTPQEAAERFLAAVGTDHRGGDRQRRQVAGRAAYELVLRPQRRPQPDHRGADRRRRREVRSAPGPGLRRGHRAGGRGGLHQVDFTVPDDGQFAFNPPPGAKVTEVKPEADSGPQERAPRRRPRQLRQQQDGDEPRSSGQGWTTVVVSKSGSSAPSATGESDEMGALLQQLPRVKGDWGSGRVLAGTAFSVVLTDDGRMAAGAVKPDVALRGTERVSAEDRRGTDRRWRPFDGLRARPGRGRRGAGVDPRADQALPGPTCGRRRRPDRAARRGVRLPRPERLGQDDHDPDAAGADLPDRRGDQAPRRHDRPPTIPAALRRVGALVEGPAFHPYLSGRANLARLDAADRYADPRTARGRIDSALDRVGLLAAATKRYRAYSLGMRQRLAIASALLMPRDLLVLDEPTNGLDPQGTREVRHLISELARDGATVLVSSHLLRRGRADVQPRRGDVQRAAGLRGPDRRPAGRHRPDRTGGHRPAPRMRRGCSANWGWPTSRVEATVGDRRCSATSRSRRSCPTWSTRTCRCWGSPWSVRASRTSSSR